ncbi:hypothetical protein ACXET9_13965 [Brachybacterium sp. DNPG3]
MGRARVDRLYEQFRRTGSVTVMASVLKGTASMVGMILMAALGAGMYAGALFDGDAGTFKAWGSLILVPFALSGAVATAWPMIRRRQLHLTPVGLEVTSMRGGRRVRMLGLRWREIEHIEFHTNTSGESTRTYVRMHLVPGAGQGSGMDAPHGYIDLPSGFTLSVKALAALMEGIRSTMAQR